MKKVLFLYTGDICYNSFYYFEKCLMREMAKKGFLCEHILIEEDREAEGLERLCGRDYDYVIDIGDALPAQKDREGRLYFNRIGGRKIHYILDHPLYHHDVLRNSLENMVCVCIDLKHEEYVRKYYPHIEGVVTLPLASDDYTSPMLDLKDETIFKREYLKRERSVVFTGTYTNPEIIKHEADELPKEKKELFFSLVELLLSDPSLTQEEALIRLVGDDGRLPVLLRENFLADVYLRALIREELLLQVLRQAIEVEITGQGWLMFRKKLSLTEPQLERFVKYTSEADYESVGGIYASARLSLNQMPWFKAGMHDRVPLAMRNGCLCMTDSSHYLENVLSLKNKEHVIFYSLEDMQAGAEELKDLLREPEGMAGIAYRGYGLAEKYMTWECHVAKLLEYLEGK